jgi:hypothetical protein
VTSPAHGIVRAVLAALLLACAPLGTVRADPPDEPAPQPGPYPPSFRRAVEQAVAGGVQQIRSTWQETPPGSGEAHGQVMGYLALPLLAALKAGVARSDPQVERAFEALRALPMRKTYGVGTYMLAIHAAYQPDVDVWEADVGRPDSRGLPPRKVRRLLSEEDRAALRAGVEFLLRAQRTGGLWHYEAPRVSRDPRRNPQGGGDLSNSLYAILGLRAAADCGERIPHDAWLAAVEGILQHQDPTGPRVALETHVARGDRLERTTTRAHARGFRYKQARHQGTSTGSMTTAGIACLTIGSEALVRVRRLGGADRKRAFEAVRDGLAWLQAHFTVTANPEDLSKQWHHDYLYGLERVGMLLSRRWIGNHDWYREGAKVLLASRDPKAGGWKGRASNNAFAILFLKRATRAADRVVITGD